MATVKIIFICYANVCRSTMAEFVFRNMIRLRGMEGLISVDSAATSDVALGHEVNEGTRAKLSEYGIPCPQHFARQLVAEDYDKADLLIGMDADNVEGIKKICGGDPDNKVCRLLEFAGMQADVSDPWHTHDFDKTYDEIIEGCRALWNVITGDV